MPAERRRVTVWLGRHPLFHYVGAPEHAAEYAAAMARRFQSLRVTNEVLADSGVLEHHPRQRRRCI
jgi:hypothetical protein